MNITRATQVYAAIRTTDGREWIDTTTLSLLRDEATQAATDTDKLIPHYAADNPVVRISRVEIREMLS